MKDNGNGRDQAGRFARGNRLGLGRPPGRLNNSTVSGIAIIAAIRQSFHDCDGPRRLRELAETDPREWLRLVVSCLPKDVKRQLANEHVVSRHADAVPVRQEFERERINGR